MTIINKGLQGVWPRQVRAALLAAVALGSAPVQAAYEGEAVTVLAQEMVQEYGFVESQVVSLFRQAERQQKILDAISRPAERVKPWKEYRPIFITDARIQQGLAFWNKHQAALAQAEEVYGVPAQFIVAIIGVETFYGRITGSYRVLDALSTLSFDYPPRQKFFRSQLKEFLLLVREEQLDPLSLKGSYAGAMGLPQFMPGSFRAYAVDFDQDGRIDIWNNPVDAIGSVASYFKRHGWAKGGQVAVRAQVTGSQFDTGVSSGLSPDTTVAKLKALGWQPETVLPDEMPVTALRLEGDQGNEYWLGLPNFYTITRYNHSAMYAMAVYQLASLMAEQQER